MLKRISKFQRCVRSFNSKQSVRNVQNLGKVCVLDIEIEGVKQIRDSNLNPILVFINPPSIKELENRLRFRQTETEDSLQKRLKTAKTEMEYGNSESSFCYTKKNAFLTIFRFLFPFAGNVPGNFDIVITNYDLKLAYQELREFVLKELETQRDEGINVILHRVQLIETP